MNQNDDDVDPNTMREHFRKLFDELYAKKPTKARDLNLRAIAPPKETGNGDAGQCR
jgi:hypothetical protein